MSSKRAFLNLAIAALAWPGSAGAQLPESWAAWSGPVGGLGIKQSRLQFSLQLERIEEPPPLRWPAMARSQGLSLSLVGRSSLAPTLAVYGRLGALSPGPEPLPSPASGLEGHGLTYGAGLSWDFSRSASASVGVDGYELRLGGTREPVLATRLGLRWRY